MLRARPRRLRRAFPQSLCLLFLGLCLAVAGICSPVVLGASGKSPCCAGAFLTSGYFAAGLPYDEVNRGSIAYDKSSNVAFGYDGVAMLTANARWKHAADTRTSLVEFAQFLAAEAGTIDPALVRFSQSSISRNFSSGGTIQDLATGLRSGTVNPADIPAIRLVQQDGNLFTLDNRRLWSFQQAEVPIPYRMATPQEAAGEAWKFTTQNGGTSIRVRGQ